MDVFPFGMELVVAVIALVVLIFVVSKCFFTVHTKQAAVIEKFGKFERIAGPGLNFKIPFIEKVGVDDLQMQILPYTMKHAYGLFDLPLHHADPFDRQIIAQALAEDVPVVTSDRAFGLYRNLKILW